MVLLVLFVLCHALNRMVLLVLFRCNQHHFSLPSHFTSQPSADATKRAAPSWCLLPSAAPNPVLHFSVNDRLLGAHLQLDLGRSFAGRYALRLLIPFDRGIEGFEDRAHWDKNASPTMTGDCA